ncbi:hypothetical protein AB0J86_09795 [Micromonospora sp. NPDC049559]|uniref:hypothetical protein n=1 Tax=Micromonospora sp. NPDC049559 TaxID=3155923 RepID=UPI00343B06B2
MAATGWKNALHGLLIFGGLGALVAVPGLVSAALPAEGPPLTGRLDIGYGATILPPPGARLDLADARPGTGDVVVLADGARITLTARSFRGPADPYLAHARHKLERDDMMRPVAAPEPIRTESGLTGERASVAATDGSADRGCYTALTAGSVGVVVLVTSVPDCAGLPPAVRAAVESIKVTEEAAP